MGKRIWRLSDEQHGVVSRTQLLALGMSESAINHRLENGRLHRIHRGVYAVGRPQLDPRGRWLAAVLACGPRAALSHKSAAALWGILHGDPKPIEVSLPMGLQRHRKGVKAYRRSRLTTADVTRHAGIPVTLPALTLIDLANQLPTARLEAAIKAADTLGLVDPEELRQAAGRAGMARGASRMRELLDRRVFAMTDSELERRFLPLSQRAGLPKPLTGANVAGYRSDFYWPGLGLVIETDGLRYHRTPTQQAKDHERDQAYAAAGLTALRFTHAQVEFEPDRVIETLRAVGTRLERRAA